MYVPPPKVCYPPTRVVGPPKGPCCSPQSKGFNGAAYKESECNPIAYYLKQGASRRVSKAFDFTPMGGQSDFVHPPRTYASCGPSVRADELVRNQENHPPEKHSHSLLRAGREAFGTQLGIKYTVVYASRAVQFHPDGGQSDFAWLSARTPHGVYVW